MFVRLFLFLICGVLSANAQDDESVFSLSGSLTGGSFLNLQGPAANEFAQNSLAFDPELKANFGSVLSFKSTAKFTEFFQSRIYPTSSEFESRLKEAYFQVDSDGFIFKLGEQIIPWGRSDGINPTDYLTAKDLSYLTTTDENRRYGSHGIHFLWTPNHGESPVQIEWVAQWDFPKTMIQIPASFSANSPVPVEYPKRVLWDWNFLDSENAVRLSYLGNSFDGSISYFHGYSHTPQFVFANQQITYYYAPMQAIGGDFSFNLPNDWMVRFESAYLIPEGGRASDPRNGLLQPPHWDSVLGIEKPLPPSFRLLVQGVLRYSSEFRDPSFVSGRTASETLILQNLARWNGILNNFVEETQGGGSVRLSFEPDESKWSAEALVFGYFTKNDLLFRPQLHFKPIDNLKATLGMDLYSGDDNGVLGALKDFSTGYFEATLLF